MPKCSAQCAQQARSMTLRKCIIERNFVSRFDRRTPLSQSLSTGGSGIWKDALHATRKQKPSLRNTVVLAVGAHAAAGQVLSGQDYLLDSYDEEVFEPSHDLRELAAAQLHSMFQVLARVSPAHSSSCRACVYARRAESLGAPQICLQRVACWPPRTPQPAAAWSPAAAAAGSSGSSSSSSSSEEMDDVLTLHRPSWECSSSASSGCDTEASLCQEEVVLLPNSNMLVLPLAEAGVLVGLLVVEVAGSIELRPPTADTASSSSSSSGAASPWGAAGPSVGGLSDDALWCLRMSVPPLAKACAMDLRAALAGAQQEAQQQLARSLLLEARGPLKVLGTFGQMLAPRLRAERAGQPESDMADGMVLQGQRLAEVVAQLEAALAAGRATAGQQQLALPAAVAAVPAAAAVGPTSRDGFFSDDESDDAEMTDAWQPEQQQQQQQPTLLMPAHDRDGRGLPAAAAVKAGYQLPEHCSSNSSSSSSCSVTSTGQQQQQEEEDLPHLPGQWTARSLESSSRSIRWGSVAPETPHPARPAATTTTTSSSSSSSEPCSAFYSAAAVAGAELDMQKTIDLELMSVDDPTAVTDNTAAVVMAPSWSKSSNGLSKATSRGSSVSKRSLGAGSSSRNVSSSSSNLQGSKQAGQGSCNLIDALSHLLTAAANLAKVQGVNFIVNDPLQLDHPVGTPGATSSTTSSSSNSSSSTNHPVSSMAPAMQRDRSSNSRSNSSEGCMLLPRPIRPLLVGLAAGTCRRVLGYVLDVALQCTPRGGQLCVTARQCSGGVEVSVMHTGQVQPGRLHTTSKAFAAAVKSSSSSSSSGTINSQQQQSGAVAPRSRSAAVAASSSSSISSNGSSSSSKRSRVVQELSSFAALRSSSSLVSLDFASHVLQTIGGRLSVVYPTHFMNAISGQLEVGSSIEVWLPPPAPGGC